MIEGWIFSLHAHHQGHQPGTPGDDIEGRVQLDGSVGDFIQDGVNHIAMVTASFVSTDRPERGEYAGSLSHSGWPFEGEMLPDGGGITASQQDEFSLDGRLGRSQELAVAEVSIAPLVE